MLKEMDAFRKYFHEKNISITEPDVTQTLTESELIKILPSHDGWIIGDDPATKNVLTAGKSGRLQAAVKWGVGVDNVDFKACADLNIPITNIPNVFGSEVSDIAIGYVIALARQTFQIDRGVRNGEWPKIQGISLAGKTAAVVGYGDIGRAVVRKLRALDVNVIVYDPGIGGSLLEDSVSISSWPCRLDEADFLVLTCSLNSSSFHMVNEEVFSLIKKGVRIVNVSRGALINEVHLVNALKSGLVHSAALDVFEVEPLPNNSFLREHPACVFGSHNASNTKDAVFRVSHMAIEKLFHFLKVQ